MKKILLLVSGVFLLFISCEDNISLDIPDGGQGRLVVLAELTLGTPSRIRVELSRAAAFRPGAMPEAERGAQVQLRDQHGGLVPLAETEAGLYELSIPQSAGIEVRTGRSYQLDINTADGAHYTSAWEPIHAVPRAESLSFSIVERQVLNESNVIETQPFLEFSITTPLRARPGAEKVRLRWEAKGVARFIELTPPGPALTKVCYVSEPLNTGSVMTFSGSGGTERLVNYPLLEKPLDWHFSRGYYLTIYQYSISKGSYEFWSRLGKTIDRDEGLFEPPAGPVASNIKNTADPEEEVLGYFTASAVDTIRLRIGAGEAGAPGQLCDGMSYFEAYDFCRDCLLLPRSTTTKPDYWID